MDPLLKWPGGKRRLLREISKLIRDPFHGYYEPFFGGGALFFSLLPGEATLSDNNPELINCYVQVRDYPCQVTERLSRYRNLEEEYYRIRSQAPQDPLERAARLIYLTTLSFNGIYRENLKGKFNVPYGRKTHLDPCDIGQIERASAALSSANIICCDFEHALLDASDGDLVYLDPPYTVSHSNNGFKKYNSKIFSWDDQIRLSKLARVLVSRGCKVVISNANHPSILELYSGFEARVIHRASVIAASSKFRGPTSECLFFGGV